MNTQVWNIASGQTCLSLQGIVDPKDHSILCINLSKDNSRLIASATSGLVVVSYDTWQKKCTLYSNITLQVWNAVSGGIIMNSLLVPLAPCARSCALSPNGSMAVAGFDDGSLKVHSDILCSFI